MNQDVQNILQLLSEKPINIDKIRKITNEISDDEVRAQCRSLVETVSRLYENEGWYRSIIDTAVDAIIVIDNNGIIQSCNQATTKLLGYTLKEMLNNNVKMLMPHETAIEHDGYIQHHLDTGENKIIGIGREIKAKHKNGRIVDLFLSVSKIHLDGEIFFAGVLHDLSDINRARERLEFSEAKNKAVLETAVDAIIVIDTAGYIQSANLATERLFGYDADFLIGKNVSVLTPEPVRSEHDSYLTNYLETGNKKVIGRGREVKAIRKDGSEFFAHLSVSEMKIAGEHYFTGIVRDITVQKEQEIKLQKINDDLIIQNNQKDLINQFYDCLKGDKTTIELAQNTIRFLVKQGNILTAACYVKYDKKINLIAHFGLNQQSLKASESHIESTGLVASVIKQSEIYSCDNDEQFNIFTESTLCKIIPQQLLFLPLIFQERAIGCLEFGLKTKLDEEKMSFLKESANILANYISTALSRDKVKHMFLKIQSQEEELRANNEELIQQTNALQASEENLRVQAEELKVMNEELNDKMELVQIQQDEIKKHNEEIEEKAQKLAESSKYKSEFLANMSHELRTPLNSLLLLSSGLKKNREGNLNESQLEDLTVIENSGKTLLNLISDILDLSKVEAGKLDISCEEITFGQLIETLSKQFQPVAVSKALSFKIKNEIESSHVFYSDTLRVEQILRNLLSNAFKFTEKGHITVTIANCVLQGNQAISGIKFIVEDSGIGIEKDKQELIFQAFQQSDGSTVRHYGGTGLGLTISMKLAKLLQGEVTLDYSEPNKGSRFIFRLPLNYSELNTVEIIKSTETVVSKANTIIDHQDVLLNEKATVADDRLSISNEDKSILIIEDDSDFAKYLIRLAHQKQFKCVVATFGEAGLRLAKQIQPSAILLDLGLPDMDGKKVLEELKNNLNTRHIPVHIMSGHDRGESWQQLGVVEFLMKPVDEAKLLQIFNTIENQTNKSIKKILVIEDDEGSQHAIKKLISHPGTNISTARTGQAAFDILNESQYDCVILDYNLPDMTALALLQKIEKTKILNQTPPIIIYTGQELTKDQYRELNRFTQSFVVKGANSPERLLDEVTLFLHSVGTSLLTEQKAILKKLHKRSDPLEGAKILLVDDDMRNSFSLSKQLKYEKVDVIIADSGKLALEKLHRLKYVDLILMDIMMPEMDGYEAIHHIRANSDWRAIPIIALTAKAMSGDKKKCLEAGANDYISKPVDFDKLLDTMRVWVDSE